MAIACAKLGRARRRTGVAPHEEALWALLADAPFQRDLATWLAAGGIEEGCATRERLLTAMEQALERGDASQAQRSFLRERYMEALKRAVFSTSRWPPGATRPAWTSCAARWPS